MKYLDRNVLNKGYQPVQIIIKNNSNKILIFSPEQVSLPCARTEDVTEKVHTSTIARAVSYGIPGLFICWPLLIPAVIDSINSEEANKALDVDYFAKAAKRQVLSPNSKLNALLFVPSGSYTSSFYITLIEEGSNKAQKLIVIAS